MYMCTKVEEKANKVREKALLSAVFIYTSSMITKGAL